MPVKSCYVSHRFHVSRDKPDAEKNFMMKIKYELFFYTAVLLLALTASCDYLPQPSKKAPRGHRHYENRHQGRWYRQETWYCSDHGKACQGEEAPGETEESSTGSGYYRVDRWG